MDWKANRRGPRNDHAHLSKRMISSPTNFIHVGHSYLSQDRFEDCEVAEEATTSLKGRPTQVSPEEEEEAGEGGRAEEEEEGGGQGREEDQDQDQDQDQGSENEGPPLSPSSPASARRNSRRISKDMISLPTHFRHLLHIDPTSADPEQLSQLLKANDDLKYDPQSDQQHQHDHNDPSGHPQEPPREPQPPPTVPKPARPSLRVRKSMIGPPTNFQHLDHISAGERLSAPESPPPLLPSEPADGEGGGAGGHRTTWEYHEGTTSHYTSPSDHYTPLTARYTTESTYDRPTSPPIRVPTTSTSTSTAPYTCLPAPHSPPASPYTSSILSSPSSSSIHTSHTSTSYSTASTPSTSLSSRYVSTHTHYTRASIHHTHSFTPYTSPTASNISSPTPYITHAPAKPTPPPLPHCLPLPGLAVSSSPSPRSAPPHRDATRKERPGSSGGGGADFDFDFHQFRVPAPPRHNGGL